MPHRTRRRAVKRERREKATEREDVRILHIMVDRIRREGRLRWEDISDGTKVKGTFGEVVFARGEIPYAPS